MSENHQQPPNANPNPAPASATPQAPDPNAPPAAPLAADPAAAPAPVFDPEKITLPEGFKAEGEGWDTFKDIAKSANLSHADAEKFVGLHAKAVDVAIKSLQEDWHRQQTDWQKEVKDDPEIGKDNYDTMRQTVSKLMDDPKFSDPKFRETLLMTGAGNNPAVVRTLFRWAKALTEGGGVSGSPATPNKEGNTGNQRPSIAEAMYGPSGPHSGGPKLS